MEIKSGHIEVFVNDTQKAKDFYVNKLGCELISEQSNGKIVWVRSGDLLILFRPGKSKAAADSYAKTNIALVLYTDNLNTAMEHLKKKGIKFKGNDGSDKCPTFCDPFGNWIQLVNPEDHN